jgi:hypothetical protein
LGVLAHEHLIGPHGKDGAALATRDVAEGVGDEGFADADGPDEGDMGARVEKAERDELVKEDAVEGDLGRRIPGFELHGGIEARALRPEGRGLTVAARGFVGEDEEKEILMRHLLAAREGETFGQGVGHAGEFEAP